MLAIWRNPELVRHVRAQLRRARVVNLSVVVVVMMVLVGLAITEPNQTRQSFCEKFYQALMVMQFALIGVWCAYSCGQGISRERELKTFDFLRTTRLTPMELVIGKVLGEPIVAYFIQGLTLPFSVITGLGAGYYLGDLLRTYGLLVVFALFISLVSLWLSMLVERSGAASFLLVGMMQMFMGAFKDSPFAGLACFSIAIPVLSIYQPRVGAPMFFGMRSSYPALTVFLYATFGAWLVLMLARNLKKDVGEMRLLSRWQALGFAAFLNGVFYALAEVHGNGDAAFPSLRPEDLAGGAVFLNALILGTLGVFLLTPHDQLKAWWRHHQAGSESYFSERGLPWPWMLPLAAMGYLMFVLQAVARFDLSFQVWPMGLTAFRMFVLTVFLVRDVLFLQWCQLTRMKQPVMKGALYVLLYYASTGIVMVTLDSLGAKPMAEMLGCLLTPWVTLADHHVIPYWQGAMFLGLGLQVALILVVLRAIDNRLRRPVIEPAIVAA